MLVGIIDIETTDFFERGGTIVEVGIAIVDTEQKTILKAFNSLCKEPKFNEKDKAAWIFKNSNLTYEEVLNCGVSFDDIKDGIQTTIDSCDIVTAFNKAFDFKFLRSRGIRITYEGKCIMLEAKDICKVPRKNGSGFKFPNVEEAWASMFPNHTYVEKHRGLDDACHEGLICWNLINEHKIDMVDSQIEEIGRL